MTPGQRLTADQEANGSGGTVLRYQSDGNMVLYGPAGPLWASGTSGAPGYVEFQPDGNLVVYDAIGAPVWDSDTRAVDATLVIEPTGLRIVALTTIWHAAVTPPPPPPPVSLGRLAVEPNGRYFRNTDTGARHDWREATGFALLALCQAGRHDEARAWIKAMRGYGVNQARVLLTYTIGGLAGVPDARPDRPGYWNAFDALHNMAGEEDFRLRDTIFGACEPFGAVWVRGGSLFVGDVFDKANAFAAEVARRVKDMTHVTLEGANEPGGTGWRHLDDALIRIGQTVKREAPNTLQNAGDLNEMDFGKMFSACFDFVDRHQDRNTGLRHIEAAKRGGEDPFRDSQPRRVPSVSGEWVNLGARRRDGNNGDPACPYPVSVAAFAGVCRARQLLPTFHWDGGLYCDLPSAETIQCLEAWRKVLDAFPMLDDTRWRGNHAREQGNYWNRDAWPSSDDIRDVERHVRDGRGPWRSFGIGAYAVCFPEPRGWDWRANLTAPAERVLHLQDDAWGVSVYRRL